MGVWSGWLIQRTLIQLKSFGLSSVMLDAEVYHLQPPSEISKVPLGGIEITGFWGG